MSHSITVRQPKWLSVVNLVVAAIAIVLAVIALVAARDDAAAGPDAVPAPAEQPRTEGVAPVAAPRAPAPGSQSRPALAFYGCDGRLGVNRC
jgi:hypothetical protein